jgi:hypothetical protein
VFWDHAFISPAPTLRFLLAVTVNCGDSDIVREFWEKLEKLVEKLRVSVHGLPYV